MRIPISLPLMGHIISVQVVAPEAWPHGDDVVGLWNPGTHEIFLHGNLTGTKLEQCFFHELQHAVLDMMGHKLARNEAFVDQSSSLWHQALSGARYARRKKPTNDMGQ